MKFGSIVLTAVLSAAVAFGVAHYAGPAGGAGAQKETAFQRVMRTNTLRCSYLVIPPQFTRDPNTEQFSGVSYDVVMEAAKRLGLNVDWTEEVNFMNVAEGFKTGRYDAFCLASYRWPPSARVMEYGEPIYMSTTSIYVRADDHRFDRDVKAIDSPDVKVAVVDGGEASAFIREADFPKSGITSLPANTDFSFVLEAVATRKADVAFSNPLMIMPYLTANPGKIRRIEGTKPLRVYAHALSFAKGEHDMVSMFDVVLDEMRNDGTIDKILNKYETVPNSFVRVPMPAKW